VAIESIVATLTIMAFCVGISSTIHNSCRCRDNQSEIKRIAHWLIFYLIFLGSCETLRLIAITWSLPAIFSYVLMASCLIASAMFLFIAIRVLLYARHVGFERSGYLKRLRRK